jgi:hypothetical protein
MKHLVSIALAFMVATTFGSASWAGGNDKTKGNAFGQAGDGNPQFKLTPEADSVAKNSNRAAEDSVDKKSNQVLLTNPNNVCNNPVSAAPGRNPHCAQNP